MTDQTNQTFVKTLDDEFDLTALSEVELAQIMEELCKEYDKCYHEMIPAYDDVWKSIKRVSQEILRRG